MKMPEKIGRYRIDSELGRGGMAVVYRAYDPRFERDVAVKILPSEFLHDPDFRARFEREAKTIAALEHPAVVQVYDFGEEEGRLFLVMRLMTGGSLAARLQRGPLPAAEVSRILKRISSALDVAHGQGIVHRDLKPGNILFDQYGEAYLSDFGIARLSEAQGTLTGSKGALGTPGYMSPEQIQGQKVDSRSDIYALGVILFEMLTGKRPFAAESPAMVLVKQMTEPAPHIREVKPDLPPSYDDVVARTMAKEPENRPDTAGEVASLLAAAAAASAEVALKLTQALELSSQTQPDDSAVHPTMVDTPPELKQLGDAESEAVVADAAEGSVGRMAEPQGDVAGAELEGEKPAKRSGWRWLLLVLILIAVALGAYWLIREQGLLSPGETAEAVPPETASSAVEVQEGPPVEEPVEEQPNIMARAETLPLMLEDGNFEGVIEEAGSIISEDDQLPFVYMFRGMAFHELGQLDAAIVDFIHAIELNPQDVEAHRQLAGIYLEGQDFEQALVHIEAAIELDPQDFASFFLRGVILQEMGDMRAAMRSFRLYVDNVPAEECPPCFEEAQQFLAEVPAAAEQERPQREGDAPGLGVETIPVGELAPEIPWLPLDEDLRPTTMLLAFNLEQELYVDLFLRRALALALDRDELARVAQEAGFVEPRGATTFTHPDTLGRDLYWDVGIPFQPDVARAMLEEAGYPEGEGLPLLELYVDEEPRNYVIIEIAAQMWRDVLGVEVEIVPVAGDYFSRVEADRPGVYRAEWAVDLNDPDNTMREAFHSQAPFNLGGFHRGDYDEIVLEAAEMAGDPAERQRNYIRAERILTEEEVAIIPLIHFYQTP